MTFDDSKHWQEMYEHEFIGNWNFLDGIAQCMTIDHADVQPVYDVKEKEKVPKPVLIFKDRELKMVVNKTNAALIEDMHGLTPAEWKGKRIAVYKTTTKVGRETKACLRILNKAPAEDQTEIDINAWLKKQMRGGR